MLQSIFTKYKSKENLEAGVQHFLVEPEILGDYQKFDHGLSYKAFKFHCSLPGKF